MPVCNGLDTGSRFARLEREQTSHWCPITRNFVELHLKRLIDAIYNENQTLKEIQNENRQDRAPMDIAYMKEELEIQKTLHSNYIDSARDILSESQLRKFRKYLDVEISRQEMMINGMESQVANREEKETDQ
ncbi:MAG: hypothetical protein PVG39_04980 [Desulfobacteraceae bacterium]|jgi:hypothetical protein